MSISVQPVMNAANTTSVTLSTYLRYGLYKQSQLYTTYVNGILAMLKYPNILYLPKFWQSIWDFIWKAGQFAL